MRRSGLAGCAVVAALLGLVLMRPVLRAPVTGDDVYYAFHAASVPVGSHVRVGTARVDVLTRLERRITDRALMDAAVATGSRPRDVLAGFRVGYLLLSFIAVYALLRTLRWRERASGELVRLRARSIWFTLVAGGLLFAAGSQSQLVGRHGLNGWVSYPVSTLTLPFSVFSVVALALWLARLSATHGWRVAVPAALGLLVIGGVTDYRYELTFITLPVLLFALTLVPVSSSARRSAGWKAKWLLGGAYVAGFVSLLIWNRLMIARACAHADCYAGVSFSPSPQMVRTFAVNVISTFPGAGTREITGLLRSQGVPAGALWTPTTWSVALAVLVLAVLAPAWWAGRASPEEMADDRASAQAEGVLCVVGASVLMVAGLCAAAMMSLSRAAQEGTSSIGLLTRSSPATWFAIALGLALLVAAVGMLRPRLAVASYVAFSLALALLVAVKVPTDGRIATADDALMRSSDRVFAQVVLGEKGEVANRRRCRLLGEVDREMSPFYAQAVRRSSDRAFEHFWRLPFCTRR